MGESRQCSSTYDILVQRCRVPMADPKGVLPWGEPRGGGARGGGAGVGGGGRWAGVTRLIMVVGASDVHRRRAILSLRLDVDAARYEVTRDLRVAVLAGGHERSLAVLVRGLKIPAR